MVDALGERLRAMGEAVEPRDEFRTALRTSLMTQAATVLTPVTPSPPSVRTAAAARVGSRRRMVIATAFIATTLGLGGVSSASASALPGEALYPFKRAGEQVELAFHRDLADRGAFQLELAERRLDEARQLAADGPESAELATKAVREFELAAAAGTADLTAAFRDDNTLTSILTLNRFAARTEPLLTSLAAQLPDGGSAALADARDRLDTIETRSQELCPTCGGLPDDGPSSRSDSEGSPQVAPEPEPQVEPESEPEAPDVTPPAEVSVPAPSNDSSDDSADQDESDEADDENADDEEADDETDQQVLEPIPTVPTPIPTPEPTLEPQPSPTPEPEPTPEPTPTEPTPTEPTPTEPTPTEPTPTEPTPPGLLDIVPETVHGVGSLVSGTVNALL
jgi:hypothetical protein